VPGIRTTSRCSRQGASTARCCSGWCPTRCRRVRSPARTTAPSGTWIGTRWAMCLPPGGACANCKRRLCPGARVYVLPCATLATTVTSCGMSCHAMSRHVVSRHVTSHFITPHYVTLRRTRHSHWRHSHCIGSHSDVAAWCVAAPWRAQQRLPHPVLVPSAAG
jgi:hypothetical protein